MSNDGGMNWKLYLTLAVVGTVFGGLCGWFAAGAYDANPMPPLQNSSFVARLCKPRCLSAVVGRGIYKSASPAPSPTGIPVPVASALVRAEAYGRDANGDDRFLRVDAQGRVECAK